MKESQTQWNGDLWCEISAFMHDRCARTHTKRMNEHKNGKDPTRIQMTNSTTINDHAQWNIQCMLNKMH